MTDNRFEYEESVLAECAQSGLAAFVDGKANRADNIVDKGGGISNERTLMDDSCRYLFAQHAVHFGREHTPEDSQFSVDLRTGMDGTIINKYNIGQKLENFVRNVLFVYQHNLEVGNGHKVCLNRFADMDLRTVFEEFDNSSPSVADEQHSMLRNMANKNIPLHNSQRRMLENLIIDDEDLQLLAEDLDDFELVPLSSPDEILNVAANLTLENGLSFNRLTHKHNHDDNFYEDVLSIDVPMDQQEQFEAPWPDGPKNDGALVSIKQNPSYRKYTKHDKNIESDPDQAEFYYLDANPDDDFETYLNWATDDNPDGVSIVNNAFDQGTCGSCWAFAAAGSLEASAARRAAYTSFTGYIKDRRGKHHNMGSASRKEAIKFAQSVEAETFKMLTLSVQELVDCDTAADQGCTGGNPLLAFFFIHRYGLTTWDRYPYVGVEGQCRKHLVRQPVASVRSWGVVSPNHEKHMELALRFVGPIAVGFNGADPSFLTYSGGIFDKYNCKQGANHALLVVGYGQEEGRHGDITKYWIVRNSWGKGWGENGFARIARHGGSSGIPGVCGIARSPSVALGGFVLEAEEIYAGYRVDIMETTQGTVQQLEYTIMEKICLGMKFDLEGMCGRASSWVDKHQAFLVGGMGLCLGILSIWLLSQDWRRRRRLLRLRKERRRVTRAPSNNGNASNNETVALLKCPHGNEASYGGSESSKP